MNYVLEGFYKQAEEMGMSREATTSFLETIEKTAAALNEYVADAAMASGDPASFMQKFAAELQDPQLLAQQQAEAAGRPNAQVNPGMLENFIKDHPTIGPYIQKLMSGGKDGAMMGGMGGGVLGLITALMTGQNPLMGLLAGGGIGALSGGAFGDKLKGIGASSPDDVAKAQAAQATNLSDIQKRDTGNMAAQDADIAKQEADFAAARAAKEQQMAQSNINTDADVTTAQNADTLAAQQQAAAKTQASQAAEGSLNKTLDARGIPNGAGATMNAVTGDAAKAQQQAAQVQQRKVDAQPGQPSMQQEVATASAANPGQPYINRNGAPDAKIHPDAGAPIKAVQGIPGGIAPKEVTGTGTSPFNTAKTLNTVPDVTKPDAVQKATGVDFSGDLQPKSPVGFNDFQVKPSFTPAAGISTQNVFSGIKHDASQAAGKALERVSKGTPFFLQKP